MSRVDLIVRGRRVYTPDGATAASIHIAAGSIESVQPFDRLTGAPVVEAGEFPVLPGLVDTHVHINEPGRTDWEGFETATMAAAAGGVTTLVDMPLNSIPATTSVEALRAKKAVASGRCWVDVGFWGGVVPGNTDQLAGLVAEGALGFKCFLAPSGVEEFQHVTEADLRLAAPELARLGAVLLVHAESPAQLRSISGDPRAYRNYLESRPAAAEVEAIALMIAISREYGTKVHIVHLSSAEALPLLRQARAEGLPITVETCTHYLAFAAEDIRDGSTEFKCAPPIRERENRLRLLAALDEGTIDLVATDHSPCPPAMKAGDFATAWGGIASLQLSLAVMWGIRPDRVPRWMSAAPARLAGLSRKGAIAAGFDADLVVWNPAGKPGPLYHRHKLTPYRVEEGAVEATFLRGQKIYEQACFGRSPIGALLRNDGQANRLPHKPELTRCKDGAVGDSPARTFSESELLACCGSREWAKRMGALQPFASADRMLEAADRIWWELRPTDWLDAFAAHPRIGEKGDATASAEQAGVRDVAQEVLKRLADGNRAYEQRFGYIYIVCASGKTATEMLEILESRLGNDPETELRIAAEQQRRITRLRLEKWLADR